MDLALPLEPADADGTLSKVPFVNLIVYVRERRLTGTVVLEGPAGRCAFSVRQGSPVKVLSSAAETRLSAVCFDMGLASLDRLEETWSVAESTRRLHGQVLVEYGVLSREALDRALAVQLERKLAQLTQLPIETRFRFYRGRDLLARYGGIDEPDLNPAKLTWRVLRQAPPWPHLERTLRKFEQVGFKLSTRANIESFSFNIEESRVIEALRAAPETFDALASKRLVPPSVLAPMIYGLLITKQLELVREPGVETPSSSGLSSVSSVFAAQAVTGPGAPILSAPLSALNRMASSPELGPTLSPALQGLRAEIEQRARDLELHDHFAFLGVDRNAQPSAISDSYYQLAARLHPDRLPPELAALQGAVGRVFARLSEAHQVLIDPKRRAAYLEGAGSLDTADDQAQVRSVLEATNAFQKAEVMLKRRDFSAAEEHARTALALDPTQAEHIALSAHLEALRSSEPARLGELAVELDRAVQLSPRSVTALYYRAQLHKKLGNHREALEDFRHVAALDPDHVDAAREVRLAEMRSSKPEITSMKPGGFFGKLFRK